MKKIAYILTLLIAVAGCTRPNESAKNNATQEPTTLVVYAYDSLTAEYSLLPKITQQFEQDNNVKIDLRSFDNTGSMLNQLIAEKDDPQADIVIGLDNVLFPKAKDAKLLQTYKPRRASELDETLWFDKDYTMTPFEYGYVGFVYDSEAIQFNEPISLADLATDTYKDKIILEQPGLSSTGTQLLLWTNAALGDAGADKFWRAMPNVALTVTPDWSSAYYDLFLKGEAPIVLSYLTSPAYHIDQEASYRYKTIPIKEGYVRQVEGIAVVNGTEQADLARAFEDYILTDLVQNQIPSTQWVFPVLGNSDQWPAAYKEITTPTNDEILSVKKADLKQLDTWIKEWNTTFNIK